MDWTLSKKGNKQRGKLLTAWLILMLISHGIAVLSYFFWNSAITSIFPNLSTQTFYIYGIIELANVVFIVFLFMWKKWAFFAFFAVIIISYIFNIMNGLGTPVSLFGSFVEPAILYFLLRSSWDLLE